MNVNGSDNPPFSVTFAKIRVPKCPTGSEELISQHVSISKHLSISQCSSLSQNSQGARDFRLPALFSKILG